MNKPKFEGKKCRFNCPYMVEEDNDFCTAYSQHLSWSHDENMQKVHQRRSKCIAEFGLDHSVDSNKKV